MNRRFQLPATRPTDSRNARSRGVGLFALLALALAAAAVRPAFASGCAGGLVIDEEGPAPIGQETCNLPSAAQPAHTPGTPGVEVTNPKLLSHLGPGADLNRALYTRWYAVGMCPDVLEPPYTYGCAPTRAVLVLVPGFEGGAATFAILAENLIRRAWSEQQIAVEVWGIDRRSNHLEDLAGLDLAEASLDPVLAIDWLYGEEVGFELDPQLSRRAVFYNETDDVPFIANWTSLVHSQDIDAVVEEARLRAPHVFLGGHSAGTGFTARYAATDFDLSGEGPPEPGYAKLSGLILLEGGGSSISSQTPSEAVLDAVEARFDGGLFGAVRDGAPRCIDGDTPCTAESADTDCAAFENRSCVEPTSAFSSSAILSPRTLATLEPIGIQMASGDADEGISIVQQGWFDDPDNSALKQVEALAVLGNVNILPLGTAQGALGAFMDDDGTIASLAFFIATSLGSGGPKNMEGLDTWIDVDEGPLPEDLPDNGPPPTETGQGSWGVEVEPTRFARLIGLLYQGATNFTDWYYPSSGLGVTSGLSLDTSALSLDPPMGRGRRDIDNRTQAAAIDVPVIALGGSNGLTTIPASFLGFASSIAPCAERFGCDGTPRVVDPENPSPAFPTFGGVAGGFEVYISEGYSHVDIVTAEDDETNSVVGPIVDFVVRIAPEPSGGGLQAAALLALITLARRRRA